MKNAFVILTAILLCLTASGQPDSLRNAGLDQYAGQAPDSISKDLKKLVHYLMVPSASEYEKARLIYGWIAMHIRYDQSAVNAGKTADFAANLVLKKKKAVCLGMSMLYEAMALEAGLDARTVIGFGKDTPAKTKQLKNPNHAWNAVKIDGEWKLLDVTWGSGYQVRQGKQQKSKRYYDPFWFDTAPEIFVYSHLPDIPKWQMLENPLNLKDFKTMPMITNLYIEKGFTIDTIFPKSMDNPKHPVVSIHYVKNDWKVLSAPADGKLQKGKSYSISIQSDYYKHAIIDNGRNDYFISSKNGILSATVVPDGKIIHVYLLKDAKTKKGEGALTYLVGK